MATNWTAYDAAVEIYGTNKENIAEIGARFPLFARTVALCNNEYLLDILKALPKVTARIVETGLKDMEDAGEAPQEEEVPKKKTTSKSNQPVAEEESDGDYSSMTSRELYSLCCERGISSKCKSRKKDALIELLEAYDNGELEEEEAPKKKASAKAKTKAKKAPEPEDDDDDWGDDDEEEEADPYAGKSAKELYKMCVDRGIKAKTKQSAEAYAKLLKKADEADAEEDTDDDDDEWEI